MIEIDEAWMAYFQELDPQVRLERLHHLTGLGDEARDFCRTIYEERYVDPKDPERKVDTWLWKFVYLPGMYRQRRFAGRAARKELSRLLRDLHLDAPETLSQTQETILYLEFRNAARRYLSTCSGDRYASTLFGFKKATEAGRRKQACQEIWMASRGLALAAKGEESLKLWCDALFDELLAYDPGSTDYYAALELDYQK